MALAPLKLGDPLDEQVFFGPLTRAAQIKLLEAQIQDAVAKGAQLKLGGYSA